MKRPVVSAPDERTRRSLRRQNWVARCLTLTNVGVWAGLASAWWHDGGNWIAILVGWLIINGVILRAAARSIAIASFQNLWTVQMGAILLLFIGIAAYHRPPAMFPATVLTAMIGLMVTWFSALVWWDSPRVIPAGICRHCGYNLKGLAGWTCPECGHEFEPEDVDRT